MKRKRGNALHRLQDRAFALSECAAFGEAVRENRLDTAHQFESKDFIGRRRL